MNLFQRHKEELRTAKISMLIVVLFLACWLPFHVYNLLFRIQWMSLEDVPSWLIGMIHILVVIYPSLSPCIFAFRCKRLQRELRKMMRKTSQLENGQILQSRRKTVTKFKLKPKTLNELKIVNEEVKPITNVSLIPAKD